MKKTILIALLSLFPLLLFAQSKPVNVRVTQIDGISVFTDSEPDSSDYELLSVISIKTRMLHTYTYSGNGYVAIRGQIVNMAVKRYLTCNAIILDFDNAKAVFIKLK